MKEKLLIGFTFLFFIQGFGQLMLTIVPYLKTEISRHAFTHFFENSVHIGTDAVHAFSPRYLHKK